MSHRTAVAGLSSSQSTDDERCRGRLVEDRLSELVMTGVAHDPDVSHAPAALGSLTSWSADARRPAHLTLTRPELMTERAAFRLFSNKETGVKDDHARAPEA